MTLQEIHEAQLELSKSKNETTAPHVFSRGSRIVTTIIEDSEANKTEVTEHEHLQIVPDTIETSRNALHTTSDTFDNSCGKHEGEVEEEGGGGGEDDANVVSLMIDNKDEELQSGCVNGSLHVPLRTKEDLDRCFETYDPRLSFKDMNLELPSIQVRSTPKATPKLEIPKGIKRANEGTRRRELDAITPPKKMARIMKAPRSVSRKVNIDLDMFHNLCLLAREVVYRTEEYVENVEIEENDAPSS
jgi:hypothetical protein